MKRSVLISVVAMGACLGGGASSDGGTSGDTLRLTATRTEGAGCTTAEPLVLVITDLHGGAPTAHHEGDGASGPGGRHDGGTTATCTKTIEDGGEWQTSCTWVAGDGADAFVEHIRIATDRSGGVIQPYLGVPPCVDVYAITNVE